MNRALLSLASALALSATAESQEPAALVLSGDFVPGVGVLTGVGAVDVGFFGDWLVEASVAGQAQPSVVLRADGVWKQVGDALPSPPGATIAAIDSPSTELFGGVAWIARLAGSPGGAQDDAVVYYQNSIWLQEGPVATWPGTNLPAGTRWLSFADVRCSSASGSVLFRGRHDDPSLAGPSESFLALGALCGSVGVLCSVDRVVAAGQPAPGLPETLDAVRLSPASAALSPSGLVAIWSADLSGDRATDGCVYRYDWPSQQHTLLAREGSPSPVPGRRWGALEAPTVAVNSAGSWTLCARLDATDPSNDEVLVCDDEVLAREGDVPPSVAPAQLVGFGRGSALIDEDGRVLWYARLSGPGSGSQALFLDDQLLVRTGVTQIGGRTLTRLDGTAGALSLSPQGDLLVFTGRLSGGLEGAFALDLGAFAPTR